LKARTELLADAGIAAAAREFFRSPEFLAAEGASHTLLIEAQGAELVAPLVVREIEGTEMRDAVSPYGYPGIGVRLPAGSAEPIDPAAIDWSATGLVSVFVRHSLGSRPPLARPTVRNRVQIADPALPRKSRMSDRQQIRRNERAGMEVRLLAGPEASEEERAAYSAAYTETMRRAGAEERYFFDRAYFDRILAFEQSWLALARTADGELAAGSICVHSDAMLHYYLSGTADAHLRGSPMKNLVSALVDLSLERGLPLNLGGGIEPGDALEEFKRGFANREQDFFTHELVCDPEAYARLSEGRDPSGFFPAYRAA
jgi:hypothetical protein